MWGWTSGMGLVWWLRELRRTLCCATCYNRLNFIFERILTITLSEPPLHLLQPQGWKNTRNICHVVFPFPREKAWLVLWAMRGRGRSPLHKKVTQASVCLQVLLLTMCIRWSLGLIHTANWEKLFRFCSLGSILTLLNTLPTPWRYVFWCVCVEWP